MTSTVVSSRPIVFAFPSEASVERCVVTLAQFALERYLDLLIPLFKKVHKIEKTEDLNVLHNTRIIWCLIRKIPSHENVPYHLMKKVALMSYLWAYKISRELETPEVNRIKRKMNTLKDRHVLMILGNLEPTTKAC